METAVGTIEILGNGSAITGVRFCDTERGLKADAAAAVDTDAADPLLERAASELESWFAGRLRDFTVPVSFSADTSDGATCGGVPARTTARSRPTAFRLAVWNAIRSIPYGETRTYGDIARAIGKPLASRAVGQALNRNPVAIIVPCHRVIGGDGSLVGFGGGLERKQTLLALERSAIERTGIVKK
jgi:methylated-DNA-[protein]-cysteine S-methyltransferase